MWKCAKNRKLNHLTCSLRAKYKRRWEKKYHLHTDHLKTIIPIEVGESLVIACITHLHSDDFLSVFLLSIFKQVTAQLLLAPPQVILITCKSPFVVRFLKTGQVCHKKIDQKTSVNMNIKMNISPIFFKQRCRFLFQLLPSRKAIGINTRSLPCLVFHARCWELPVSIWALIFTNKIIEDLKHIVV